MLNHHTRATVADPGLSKRGRRSSCHLMDLPVYQNIQLFSNSAELLIINYFVAIKKFLVTSQTIEELSR